MENSYSLARLILLTFSSFFFLLGYRLFGTKCDKCGQFFKRDDLVMRAKSKIYHIECFKCVACRKRLMPGDEFALRPDGLFCREDHEELSLKSLNNENNNNNNTVTNNNNNSNNNSNSSSNSVHQQNHNEGSNSGECIFCCILPGDGVVIIDIYTETRCPTPLCSAWKCMC